MTSINIGIVQEGPVFLDLQASLKKIKAICEEAAQQQTQLLVFGETWLCGYPAWLDYLPNIALWDHPTTKQAFRRMHENGVEVPGPVTEELASLAQQYQLYLLIGISEVVRQGAYHGTLFNSFLLFDPAGQLILHHRKLMPTYTEKLLYGLGDHRGLKTVETPFGKIGGLICWEHWMPLTRQAIHQAGEHIHVALWPAVKEMHQIASRHYAFEGRCFVIAAGQVLPSQEVLSALQLQQQPPDLPNLFLNGGSAVIGPDGNYVLEPQFGNTGVLYTQIPDISRIYDERLTLDTSGHYARPDIFNFSLQPPPK